MSDSCTLCGLPTPDPPVTGADADGRFCCEGCLVVARTLDDPGDADPDAVRAGLRESPDDAGTPDDAAEAFLSVDGMHCATCEAFLESRATDEAGVYDAEASYAAEVLRVRYDPESADEAALAERVSGAGYDATPAEAGVDAGDTETLGRLIVGGFLGMMTMLWYVLLLYPAYLGVPGDLLLFDLTGGAGRYLLANVWVFTTVVLAYTGAPIFRGALVSLRAGQPNMDLLVAVAATTAYVYSTLAILFGRVEVYFDVTVAVVLVVTIGNYYERRIKRRATERLTDLTDQQVRAATRLIDGRDSVSDDPAEETVDVVDLTAGDRVLVRAGDRIPVDGTVVEGEAAVDESLVTGESVPVRRTPGDEAVGGAVVADGRLVVEVGPDATSTVDRLTELLFRVQSGRGGAQRLADRLAAAFVPLVVLVAVVATGWHLLAGAAPQDALLTGLAVLVVSCPCALGLATPLAIARGVAAGLDRGVVVADRSLFERARETDVVALDKTGTLTEGEMRVVDTAGEGVGVAAAVERYAAHPVAGALREAVDAPDLDVTEFETHPGRGVSATVSGDAPSSDGERPVSGDDAALPADGARVVAGTRDLCRAFDLAVPDDLSERYDAAREAGQVPSLVGWDGSVRGLFVAADRPREGWEDAVSALAGPDREVVVVTGDGPAAAERFREHPAVDEVLAEVRPEAKTAVVERLRSRGTVTMVGDGANDAPALAAADVGIALASGTQLAADAADAVVVSGGLDTVPTVFEIAEATRERIRQNLAWAFLYNAVAVPAALLGLLSPLVAAGAMAASSLLVVSNSARSLVDDRDDRPAVSSTGNEGGSSSGSPTELPPNDGPVADPPAADAPGAEGVSR